MLRTGVVVGTTLLALGLTLGLTVGREEAAEAIDQRNRAVSSQQAGLLADYFERARAVMLLTAQNPAFADFYESDLGRRALIERGGPRITDVTDALGYLEALYPEQIGEACFIDRGGSENARVVEGEAAPPGELSTDEADNDFFAPTFGVGAGTVYQAPPYLSPDTGEWVMSNSTTIADERGRPVALVHFEITMESVRRQLMGTGLEGFLVDRRSGGILVATARPVDGTAPAPADDRFEVLTGGTATGAIETDGRRYAFRQVPPAEGNANDWYVVAGGTAAPGLLGGFASRYLALVFTGAVIVGLALIADRLYRGELAHSLTDELTGLPSRRLLFGRMEEALTEARSSGVSFAVLMADLDRFKEVNDALGHGAGDVLLREVAQRLRRVVGDQGLVARLGGDEFAVVVTGPGSRSRVEEIARRARERLRAPVAIGGVTVRTSASVGGALFPDHGTTVETLLAHADVALYQSKAFPTHLTWYDPAADPNSPERLQLVADLALTVRAGLLEVHYQPKLDVASGRPVGVEALARWTHPELGPIPPEEFIAMAERTDLMAPLTEHVLTEALGHAARWAAAGRDLSVAVNVSGSLLAGTLADLVHRGLRAHDLRPEALTLEITESAIVADPDRAMAVLAELGSIGVVISIDDFGTGFSSLAQLRSLPAAELKIDRSFITRLGSEDRDATIVRATIDLAHDLGLRVVGEGVETEEALAALRSFGCDVVQGFLFAPALPVDGLEAWLEHRRSSPLTGRSRAVEAGDDETDASTPTRAW